MLEFLIVGAALVLVNAGGHSPSSSARLIGQVTGKTAGSLRRIRAEADRLRQEAFERAARSATSLHQKDDKGTTSSTSSTHSSSSSSSSSLLLHEQEKLSQRLSQFRDIQAEAVSLLKIYPTSHPSTSMMTSSYEYIRSGVRTNNDLSSSSSPSNNNTTTNDGSGRSSSSSIFSDAELAVAISGGGTTSKGQATFISASLTMPTSSATTPFVVAAAAEAIHNEWDISSNNGRRRPHVWSSLSSSSPSSSPVTTNISSSENTTKVQVPLSNVPFAQKSKSTMKIASSAQQMANVIHLEKFFESKQHTK